MRTRNLVMLAGAFAARFAFAALPTTGTPPAVHFDAAELGNFTLVEEGGVSYVTEWKGSSGTTVKAISATGYQRPTLSTFNGRPVVDFGEKRMNADRAESAALFWTAEDTAIREVFMVFRDRPNTAVEKGGYQFLLTMRTDYSFHRGDYGELFFGGSYTAKAITDGCIELDGATATAATVPDSGFHIIHLRTTGNVKAGSFACDRNQYSAGGLILAETVIWDAELSAAEAKSVYDYLYGKWLFSSDVVYDFNEGTLSPKVTGRLANGQGASAEVYVAKTREALDNPGSCTHSPAELTSVDAEGCVTYTWRAGDLERGMAWWYKVVTPAYISDARQFYVLPSGCAAGSGGKIGMLPTGEIIHVFDEVGEHTFIAPASGLDELRVLAVGGGGAGGRGGEFEISPGTKRGGSGGGGAGGGLLDVTISVEPLHAYAVTVGAGGIPSSDTATPGGNGGNSSFADLVVAFGGGAGGNSNCDGVAGGNGGGGGGYFNTSQPAGGAGTQYYLDDEKVFGVAGGRAGNGTCGGSGAGAGDSGEIYAAAQDGNFGRGGAGKACDITGEPVTYAGGGGGGAFPHNSGVGTAGGEGGGGSGGRYTCPAGSGVDGLGGGGGGGGNTQEQLGGNGGSGVVILRYKPLVPEMSVAVTAAQVGPAYAKIDVTPAYIGNDEDTAAIYMALARKGQPTGAFACVNDSLALGATQTQNYLGLSPNTDYTVTVVMSNSVEGVERTLDIRTAAGGLPASGGRRTLLADGSYVHVFDEPGEFEFVTPPQFSAEIDYLVIGGGGSGGNGAYTNPGGPGGGGGAGGVLTGRVAYAEANERVLVKVGAGGVSSEANAATGVNGECSFVNLGIELKALGGGGGGHYGFSSYGGTGPGQDGGNGGGAGTGAGVYTNADGGAGTQVDLDGNMIGFRGGDSTSAGAGGGAGAGGDGVSSVYELKKGEDGQYLRDDSGRFIVERNEPGAGGPGITNRLNGLTRVVDTTFAWGGQPGSANTAPASAADGTGAGGDGGNSGVETFRGGNGGGGVVVLRYVPTGGFPDAPRANLAGVSINADYSVSVDYSVIWAGSGKDTTDLNLLWWPADNPADIHRVALAKDVIGEGRATLPLGTIPLGATVGMKLEADNGVATGTEGLATAFTMKGGAVIADAVVYETNGVLRCDGVALDDAGVGSGELTLRWGYAADALENSVSLGAFEAAGELPAFGCAGVAVEPRTPIFYQVIARNTLGDSTCTSESAIGVAGAWILGGSADVVTFSESSGWSFVCGTDEDGGITLERLLESGAAVSLDFNDPIVDASGAAIADARIVALGTVLKGNVKIEEIVLPPTVTSFSAEAFADCAVLRRVSGLSSATETLPARMFLRCSKLTGDIADFLPPTLTSLEAAVFLGCNGLTGAADFTKCPGVTEIKEAAFSQTMITSIDLGTVTAVGYEAFFGCSEVSDVVFGRKPVRLVNSDGSGHKSGVFTGMSDASFTFTGAMPVFAVDPIAYPCFVSGGTKKPFRFLVGSKTVDDWQGGACYGSLTPADRAANAASRAPVRNSRLMGVWHDAGGDRHLIESDRLGARLIIK